MRNQLHLLLAITLTSGTFAIAHQTSDTRELNPINLRSSSNKDRPLGYDTIRFGANDQPLAWNRSTGEVVVIRQGMLPTNRIIEAEPYQAQTAGERMPH